MTDPRETLNRIRKQADAATEGPWQTDTSAHVLTVDNTPTFVARCADPNDSDAGVPDAEFIAAARTDVPALLDALEKVLRLHPRVVVLHADPEFGRMEDDAICGACIVNHEAADWPCPNVRAITTALDGIR